MPVLALAIIFQVGFGLVMRDAAHRRLDLYAVGAVNYVVAAVACALGAWATGGPTPLSPTVLWLGAGTGLSYILSYFFMMYTVQRVGISVPMAIVRMSVLVPVIGAVFLFHELPGPFQVAGIALVCVAFPFLAFGRHGHHVEAWWVFAVLAGFLFLFTGANQLGQKTFATLGRPDARWLFLAVLFGVATIVSLVPVVSSRRRPTRSDCYHGLALGATNVLANFLMLRVLSYLPAIVVFPVASGAGVVLTTFAATVFWRESLSRRILIGLAIAVAAVVLINISGAGQSG